MFHSNDCVKRKKKEMIYVKNCITMPGYTISK